MSGDLLRQLGRGVLDGPNSQAQQRLADAAATVLLVAGQAVGIGQDDVLDVIRAAFHQAGVSAGLCKCVTAGWVRPAPAGPGT